MIKDAIAKLAEKIDLSEKEAEEVMGEIMAGAATSAQIAAYLMGLRLKGETAEEITGSVKAMRDKAVRILVADPLVIDTCGTGGDGAHTFNISTAAAFVAAGGGLTVAKHGGRAVSSRSGSADVLSALGVHVELAPGWVEDCINEVGIGFLFAPLFHGAMKHCAAARQEMGIRTLLNIMGPMSNPARAGYQVLGVYDEALTELMAKVLLGLGTQHCFIVHGMDGLDEITLTDRTKVSEGKGGVVSTYFVEPKDFGLERVRAKELAGGSPEENAHVLRDILQGRPGPKSDVVCLNAAPAFVQETAKARKAADGLDPSLRLPLVDLALPALRQLSPAQAQAFRQQLAVLVEADRRVTLFEFALLKVVDFRLVSAFEPARKILHKDVRPLAGDVAALLAALIEASDSDAEKAKAAFEAAAAKLPMPLTPPGAGGFDPQAANLALQKLAASSLGVKRTAFDACAEAVLHDGVVELEEAELLRAVAYCLELPLPPFLPN